MHMRVGFDAHMIGQRETGNETYAIGLLSGFEQIGVRLDTYLTAHLPASFHRQHLIWPRVPSLRIPVVAPILALRDRLSVYHGTYVLPPVLPCASVVTVHDMTFALHPDWFNSRERSMLNTLVPFTVRRAAGIVTISECTKRDIVERLGIAPERIAVTYLAPRPMFSTPRAPVESADPFLLFVGNVQPRKNVDTVLHALRLVHDRGIKIRLVVAGKPGLHHDRIQRVAVRLRLTDAVCFTGYVSDERLLELYQRATVLVHPALYEGFGLTVIEAMAQGLPVIASSTGSLPELTSDAAVLINPLDIEAWADSMAALLSSEERCNDLAARGLVRAQQFSWERCARETLSVYEKVG